MSSWGRHWPALTGGLFLAIFLVFLTMKMGWLSRSLAGDPLPGLSRPLASERVESLRIISQEGVAIGYTRRILSPEDGGWFWEEMTYLQLNHLGVPQEIRTDLTARLGPSGGLVDFSYRIASGLFAYLLEGKAARDGIRVFPGGEKGGREMTLPMPPGGPVYLPSILPGFLNAGGWPPGEERVFSILDPTGPAVRQFRVTHHGPKTVTIGRDSWPTQEYSLNFSGITQIAWVGKGGEILRETGPLSLVIEKAPPGWQTRDLPDLPRRDLADLAAVIPTGLPIKNPEELRKLTLRMGSVGGAKLHLEGGRQSFAGDTLTITREDHPSFSPRPDNAKDWEDYLRAGPFLQSDHPEIKRTVGKIIGSDDSPRVKAHKIVTWVYENIAKEPVFSLPDALETLRLKVGDCNEHAQLVAALGRAAGIPTGIEIGLAYQQGRFYYHAWNVFYLDGGWVTADATRGSLPALVTNIRLWRTDEGAPLEILGLIGKIRLEIARVEK